MSIKVRIFSMLITLHSLGLLLASLFTYKWYVDEKREVGVFGICQFLNKTTVDRMILPENNTKAIDLIKHIDLSRRIPIDIDLLMPRQRTINLFSSQTVNRKCYQLLWPNTEEAFKYLSSIY